MPPDPHAERAVSQPSIIERVMAAISQHNTLTPEGRYRCACAALAAIREPTQAQLEAAVPEPKHLYDGVNRGADYQRDMLAAYITTRALVRQMWHYMIDAALANPLHPAEDRGESGGGDG